MSKEKCYNCNKFGHYARDCRQKNKANEQSNLIEEDIEPTLLMDFIEETTEHEEAFLNEKEVQPNNYNTTNQNLWYLDNGASSHMTGVRTHFIEIDERVSGNVRFRDGS